MKLLPVVSSETRTLVGDTISPSSKATLQLIQKSFSSPEDADTFLFTSPDEKSRQMLLFELENGATVSSTNENNVNVQIEEDSDQTTVYAEAQTLFFPEEERIGLLERKIRETIDRESAREFKGLNSLDITPEQIQRLINALIAISMLNGRYETENEVFTLSETEIHTWEDFIYVMRLNKIKVGRSPEEQVEWVLKGIEWLAGSDARSTPFYLQRLARKMLALEGITKGF